MNFTEALQQLVDQKYVQREAWTDGSYLALMPGMQTVWKIQTVPNPNAGNWLPLVEDMLATDWKAYEKPVPVVTPETAPTA